MELASSSGLVRGFVLDFIIVNSSSNPYTFQGDTTYLVSGPSYFSSTVTFESGAVIKYAPNTSLIISDPGQMICEGTAYRPTIFTAKDDDTVGSVISDSTGQPSGPNYANPAITCYVGTGPLNFHDFRIAYAQEAIYYSGALDATVSDGQIVHGATVFCTPGNGGVDTFNNVLFSGTGPAFMIDWGTINAYNCTFDQNGTHRRMLAPVPGHAPDWLQHLNLFNCIVANVNYYTYHTPLITGDHNGFYNSGADSVSDYGGTTFGTSPIEVSEPPFQSAAGGNYYLATNPDGSDASGFRGQGTTTGVDPALLADLKTNTTYPPIALPALMTISGNLTLFPQIPRYTSGNPDLGYYYPALDYTVATMILAGGAVTVEPGTAIGVRNDYINDLANGPWWTTVGFWIEQGSSFVSHGTPTAPNVFTSAAMVQEQPQTDFAQYQDAILYYYGLQPANTVSFVTDFEPNALNLPAPTLDFRFSKFYLTGLDYHIWAGFDEYDFYEASPDSSIFLNLRDCEIYGGRLNLGNPDYSYYDPSQVYAPGAVSWFDNLFDRVTINLDPTYYWYNGVINCDMQIQAYNNLFRGGPFLHLEPFPATAGNWKFEDNLFDKVNFVQDVDCYGQGPVQPLDYDYNAYWPLTADELTAEQGNYPFAEPPNAAELQLSDTSNDGFTDGTPGNHEVVLSSAPPYQTGPLGNYYLPATTPLYNVGSRSAAAAGLAQYTTQVSQAKDSGQVDIGLHYVATSSSTSTIPKDTDNNNIADYVADANGNGVWDQTTETDWQNGSASDAYSTIYDDVDLSGDGLVGRIKKALGMSPFDTSNPLTLTQVATGQEPDIVAFEVPIQYSTLNSIGELELSVDGKIATLNECDQAINGHCLLKWNADYEPPGPHSVQAEFTIGGQVSGGVIGGTDTFVGSGTGPSQQFNSPTAAQFYAATAGFMSSGTTLYATTPTSQNATYTIDLYDPSTTPPTLIRSFSGSTSTGVIQESWDGKYSNETQFTGDKVEAEYTITLGSDPVRQVQILNAWDIVNPGNNFDVAYAFDCNASLLQQNGEFWNQMLGVVDVLIMPNLGLDVYHSTFDRFFCVNCSPGPYPGYIADRNTFYNGLLSNLEQNDVENFYYYGHGQQSLISGVRIVTVGSTQPYLLTSEVANGLGNTASVQDGFKNRHEYRFVFLDACSTAKDQQWQHAFGIYDDIPAADVIGLPDQAFLGWVDDVTHGITDVTTAKDCGTTLNRFFADWMNGKTLDYCIRDCSVNYIDNHTSGLHWPLPVPGNEIIQLSNGEIVQIPLQTAPLKLAGNPGLMRRGSDPAYVPGVYLYGAERQ